MERKSGFWRAFWGLFLGLMLLAPGLVLAKEEPPAGQMMDRGKLIKELNLSPEKAKEFEALGAKYAQGRKEIIDRIKKNEMELEKSLAVPQPEEGKIKDLAATVTADHDKLFETFKNQRQEELRLLTPVQQGKFILALKKWHEEMCKK